MAIDRKKVTLLLLFDFSKAFDTISPTKLLSKLRQLCFSRTALLWIRSYLEGRTQIVNSKNNGNSDWLETNLGVPQGSLVHCSSAYTSMIYRTLLMDVRSSISSSQMTFKSTHTSP